MSTIPLRNHVEDTDADGEFFFDDGLFGFPGCRRFVLRPTARAGFYWLQSLESEALAFVLADPFQLIDGFSVELPDIEVARLRAQHPSDIAVLTVVTLARSEHEPSTCNLQAPICLNVRTGRGRQLILNDPAAPIRQPLAA